MELVITKKLIDELKEIPLTILDFAVLYGKVFKQDWLVKEALRGGASMDPEEDSNVILEYLKHLGYLGARYQLLKVGKEEVKRILNASTSQEWDHEKFDQNFEELWEAFPKSDAHSHFKATGLKRKNKAKCRKLAYNLWLEGEDLETITKLVRADVLDRIKTSTMNNNRLTFMQNPENYLRDRAWEIVKESVSLQEQSINLHGKDIS